MSYKNKSFFHTNNLKITNYNKKSKKKIYHDLSHFHSHAFLQKKQFSRNKKNKSLMKINRFSFLKNISEKGNFLKKNQNSFCEKKFLNSFNHKQISPKLFFN